MSDTFDFGLIGLGVMGRNFLLNVADHGFGALGLTSREEKVKQLEEEAGERKVTATTDMADFIARLSRPRKIMLLVPAGEPVDSTIEDLLPHLEQGDIIIDGGNSFFPDTDRREEYLKSKGIHFFGSGVSGGAKGARFGPSIMPGGDREAYEVIRPIFEAVSAKVNGEPCVDYLGRRSAGNYVKMIHNGIEYGLMEQISECYDIMKRGVGMSNEELQKTFSAWNQGRLQSFLIDITQDIFTKKDDETGNDLVDMILDKAKQKGTGKWTSQNAMDLGIPIPSIDVSVSMRQLSAMKDTRVKAEEIYGARNSHSAEITASDVEQALYFSYLVTYAQGMTLLQAASEEYDYGLDMETIARIWRGGCIIRAALLEDIRQAFDRDKQLVSLLLDTDYAAKVKDCVEGARKVSSYAISSGIPVPGLASCIGYFDAFTTGRLPMNLLQAQRDHFGEHTYERIDREGIFHTDW